MLYWSPYIPVIGIIMTILRANKEKDTCIEYHRHMIISALVQIASITLIVYFLGTFIKL